MLAPSNFRKWRGDINNCEQLAEQIELFAQIEKEQAKTEDILYELLLKFGYPLDIAIDIFSIKNVAVFAIDNQQVIFVLDDFNQAMIVPLIKLKPRQIIALDRVFQKSDALKSNLVLQCRDADIRLTCI